MTRDAQNVRRAHIKTAVAVDMARSVQLVNMRLQPARTEQTCTLEKSPELDVVKEENYDAHRGILYICALEPVYAFDFAPTMEMEKKPFQPRHLDRILVTMYIRQYSP